MEDALKKFLFLLISALFVCSCASDEEPECVTKEDCGSGMVCSNGYCVPEGLVQPDADNTLPDSGDTLPDSGDTELPDTGDTAQDSDNTPDEDSAPDTGDTLPDGEPTPDTGDTAQDADTTTDEDPDTDEEPAPDSDIQRECETSADCSANFNKILCDTAAGKCVICVSDSDCRTELGEGCDPASNECVQASNCFAAIRKLPHGGFYDWDDNTSQGFIPNTYWNVNDKLSRSGSYSYGRYNENMNYSANMDFISLLAECDPAEANCFSGDLSACSVCTVDVTFYHSGKTGDSTGNPRDYIHPVCNGAGNKQVKNSTNSLNSSTHVPESHWSYAQFHNQFWNYPNNFSTQLKWTMDSSCLTDKFVFGMRFWSNSSGQSAGLVADDLRIAPAASEAPVGKIISAESEKITGWACDPDKLSAYLLLQVKYYKNGDKSADPIVKNIRAALQKPDFSDMITQCNTNNHGFEMLHDEELKSLLGSGTHTVDVLAFDLQASKNLCGSGYTAIGETTFTIE